MKKRKAFKYIFDLLNEWTEECKKAGARDVEAHFHLGKGDFCGELIIKVARPGKDYEDTLLNNIFNDDETMRLDFDSTEELIEIIKKIPNFK